MMFEFGETKPHDLHRQYINHLLKDLIKENKIEIEEKLKDLDTLIICSLKSIIGSIDVSLTGYTNKPETDIIYQGIRNAFMINLMDGFKHLDQFFSEDGEFYTQKGIVISKAVVDDLFRDKG